MVEFVSRGAVVFVGLERGFGQQRRFWPQNTVCTGHEQAYLRIGPLVALAATIGPVARAIVDVRRRIWIMVLAPPVARGGHGGVRGRVCEDRAVGLGRMGEYSYNSITR